LVKKAIKIGAKLKEDDGMNDAYTPAVIRELIKFYYEDKITLLKEQN
jgi:hypothetical protein